VASFQRRMLSSRFCIGTASFIRCVRVFSLMSSSATWKLPCFSAPRSNSIEIPARPGSAAKQRLELGVDGRAGVALFARPLVVDPGVELRVVHVHDLVERRRRCLGMVPRVETIHNSGDGTASAARQRLRLAKDELRRQRCELGVGQDAAVAALHEGGPAE